MYQRKQLKSEKFTFFIFVTFDSTTAPNQKYTFYLDLSSRPKKANYININLTSFFPSLFLESLGFESNNGGNGNRETTVISGSAGVKGRGQRLSGRRQSIQVMNGITGSAATTKAGPMPHVSQ